MKTVEVYVVGKVSGGARDALLGPGADHDGGIRIRLHRWDECLRNSRE